MLIRTSIYSATILMLCILRRNVCENIYLEWFYDWSTARFAGSEHLMVAASAKELVTFHASHFLCHV
jgi:hypothetical protein